MEEGVIVLERHADVEAAVGTPVGQVWGDGVEGGVEVEHGVGEQTGGGLVVRGEALVHFGATPPTPVYDGGGVLVRHWHSRSSAGQLHHRHYHYYYYLK